MKIALVIDQYDSLDNGTTVSAQRFVENLRNRGHEVRILTTGVQSEYKYVVKDRYIPFVSKVAKKQGMIFGKPNDDVIRKAFDGVDLVHFMLPNLLSKRARKIADEMDLPKIAAFHMQPESITYAIGLGRSQWINDIVYRHLRKVFYNYFDDIHCPTNFIAGELKRNHYKANLHVISNGVDSAFKPLKVKKSKQLRNKITLLTIGRFAKEKRQDVLIKAISKSKYRNRIQLIMAGHGPLENKYRRLSSNLPIRTIFGFYHKNELIKIINSSDLYIHAADAEIEAISCMEAFACGTVPIIADSRKSATKQFALDDRNIFKSGDVADLAKKIDYLIEHDDERSELAEKYIALGETYRVSNSVDEIEKVYQDIINKKKTSNMMNI